MSALVLQRCTHHPDREAAARCPECSRFFCRECITEHDDRVICADCLRRLLAANTPVRRRRWVAGPLAAVKCMAALFLAWIFFYAGGWILLRIPSSFHEGTLWEMRTD